MPPKKIGRHISENPKSKTLRIRVDVETLLKLDKCSLALNTNRSEIIRKGINRIYEDCQK